MLFLRYENFRQYLRLYPLTSLLLAANIIVFILMTLDGGSENAETLLRYGALVNDPPFIGEYWRYFSSLFVHIGFDHLLFNSFSILVFAPPLERLLGWFKFAVLYLGSGFAGGALSVAVWTEVHLTAGASSSIYGVFASFLYLGLFKRHLLDPASRKTIISVVIIGAVFSVVMPSVNLLGHLGGLLGGFVLFHLLKPKM